MELVNPADVSVVMYPGVYGMMLPVQMMGVFSQMARGAAVPAAGGAAARCKAGASAGAARASRGGCRAEPGGVGGDGSGQLGGSSLGRMSVPQNWAAAAPAPMLGGVPLGAVPLAPPATGVGAGSGAPLMFGGLPRAAAAGGAGAGTYGVRPTAVMARPRPPAMARFRHRCQPRPTGSHCRRRSPATSGHRLPTHERTRAGYRIAR